LLTLDTLSYNGDRLRRDEAIAVLTRLRNAGYTLTADVAYAWAFAK